MVPCGKVSAVDRRPTETVVELAAKEARCHFREHHLQKHVPLDL